MTSANKATILTAKQAKILEDAEKEEQRRAERIAKEEAERPARDAAEKVASAERERFWRKVLPLFTGLLLPVVHKLGVVTRVDANVGGYSWHSMTIALELFGHKATLRLDDNGPIEPVATEPLAE